MNDRPKKRKASAPSREFFRKQRKSEEATLDYNFTKNPQFQFNLTYKIKEYKSVENSILGPQTARIHP